MIWAVLEEFWRLRGIFDVFAGDVLNFELRTWIIPAGKSQFFTTIWEIFFIFSNHSLVCTVIGRPFVWCHPSCWAPLHAACILAWKLTLSYFVLQKGVGDEQKLATCREITIKYCFHDDKDPIMKSKQDFSWTELSIQLVWWYQLLPRATNRSWEDTDCCVLMRPNDLYSDMSAVVVVGSLGEPKQPMLDGWWQNHFPSCSGITETNIFIDDHLICLGHI